ncbi:MAG: hypothetical protein U5M50_08625 [Sphingobium sp.]|nr:hypothetical protein [Sphingobium sp.]
MDRPFVLDAGLSAIAIGYKNPSAAYVADKVLPREQVTQEKFKWTLYPIEEGFNVPDARVSRKGRVQQLEFGGTEQTSSVEDFGLDAPIPYSDIDAAAKARAAGTSNFDPEGRAVMMLTDAMLNQREVRVAGMVQNAANYSAGRKTTLAGNAQFSDYANSDPIGRISAGCDATLVFRPTIGVMGRAVWSIVNKHPKVVNAVKGNVTDSGIITLAQWTELFRDEGIQEWIIGDSFYNTAKPGQVANVQRAWGKHISLLHVNPNATPESGGITFGLTAQYGNRIAGRIEDKDIGLQGGVRIRSGERVKELIVAPDVGYFIQNAVA